MSEFLDMGGYAAFVWPSYGLVALVLGVLAWTSWRARAAATAALAALEGDGP
jgi:heme exporter protein D